MEEFVSVPCIVLIVYMVIEVIKLCSSSQVVSKLFPMISCVLGIGLGLVAFFCCPTIIPAGNVLSAILIGGASGLSATGANQIIKQLVSKNNELKDLDDNDETEQTVDQKQDDASKIDSKN